MRPVDGAQQLLSWFDRHRRDLPWRATHDPYRIWLSEVMLQQTRVETVLPYYARFLARFPTVAELAAAPLDEVLALWSGLGYYRRARQLHAAARQVVERHGGTFPADVAQLRELPGIGGYTAAAVASIAFGVVEPVLDGNVERVLARRLALDDDPKTTKARRVLLAAAAALLDGERPGDSNQALMELGATVCAVRRPRCLLCPLREGCRAAAEGAAELYPKAARKRQSVRVDLVAAVVRQGDRVLLFRRAEDSALLAGTWELPWIETGGGEPAAGLAGRYGGVWTLARRLGEVRHGITYRDLRVEVWSAELAAGGSVAEGPEAGWFDREQRGRLALSSLVEKVLAKLARERPA